MSNGMFRRSGLAIRLAAGFMAVSGTLLALYGWWASQVAERTLRDELGRKLSDMAFLATADDRVMALPYAVRDGAVVNAARERLSAIVKTSGIANLIVVDRDNLVLVDARGHYRFREQALLLQLDRSELERVWEGDQVASRIYEGEDRSLYLSAYAPLIVDGSVRAVVGAEASAAFLSNVRKMRAKFAWSAALVLVLAGFLGALVAGTITRPVRILRAAADRVARGDYTVIANVDAGHELGDLALAFNRMAQSINANHERILESMSDGMVAVDEAGRVNTVNHSAEVFLGVKRDDIIGRAHREVLPGWLSGILDDTLSGGFVQDGLRISVPAGNGERIVEVSTTPLRDSREALRGAEAEFSDRTELERLSEALEAQKRFSAIGEMAATVAHEVRNPLASIQGFADLLKMEVGESGKAREYLGDLLAEVRRMEKIVGSFLVYARPPRPEIIPVEPVSVVQEVAKSMRPEFEKAGVKLEIFGAERVSMVRADRKMMQMVLANLLRNSLEASTAGGRVRIGADEAGVSGGGVRFTVEDEGSGLDPEVIPRLFTPFTTTKAQGTGLGLSLSKKFVDAHGGTISLAAMDKGARAEVVFPVEPITEET
jgi:PAS domain S-box-containing protein